MSAFSLLSFIINHPLNKGDTIGALSRFAKWQLGSRLTNCMIVYDCVNGSKFFVRTGETGLTGNIYTGLHEFTDMAFLLHVLRDDELFVDVGANVGSYTILACSALAARGFAIEPVPTTYRRLADNIRLNRIEERVQCFNIGIGREPGFVKFTSDLDTVNHALAENEESANAVDVEVLTLDAVLKDAQPSLIKIDVEGFETPVLEGASKVLENTELHSVIMELNGSGSRYGYDETRILEMMFDHGFKTYSYNPFDRVLINLNGKNLMSGNTLFVRNETNVSKRLKAAPKVTVHGKTF